MGLMICFIPPLFLTLCFFSSQDDFRLGLREILALSSIPFFLIYPTLACKWKNFLLLTLLSGSLSLSLYVQTIYRVRAGSFAFIAVEHMFVLPLFSGLGHLSYLSRFCGGFNTIFLQAFSLGFTMGSG